MLVLVPSGQQADAFRLTVQVDISKMRLLFVLLAASALICASYAVPDEKALLRYLFNRVVQLQANGKIAEFM